MLVKILLCLTFLSLLRNASSEKPQIAIVGSGIGGSSCSYFLREHLKDEIDIDLYEADEIGGRLATVADKDKLYEIGGCVIHERNKYMNSFREKLELKKLADDSGGRLAIRDGDGIKFLSSKSAIITYAKLIWQYGFLSLFRLHRFIGHLLDQFDNIYKLQEQGKAFTTVKELFVEANPEFLTYFNISAKEGFQSLVHLNERTVDDLVRATLRVNYGQSTGVHLFVGAVSVAGMFGALWAIEGGNRQVPELLVKKSGVNFLNNRVEKIAFDQTNKKYIVESVSKSSEKKLVKTYDIVVIASPITSDSQTPIAFINFTKPITVEGQYHRTVATLVKGNLNANYYHLVEDDIPDVIINNDEKEFINSIGNSRSINVRKIKTNVWKVFSQRPLKNHELNALFQAPKIIGFKDWLAYPKYEKLEVSGNFILHHRLYYLNAIEWASSAMEMSLIGAKNVALLVEKELSLNKPVSYSSKFEKVEL